VQEVLVDRCEFGAELLVQELKYLLVTAHSATLTETAPRTAEPAGPAVPAAAPTGQRPSIMSWIFPRQPPQPVLARVSLATASTVEAPSTIAARILSSVTARQIQVNTMLAGSLQGSGFGLG
jgi:hypothetical protein